MSGEVWTFDAEVGPMLNKIRQINNEQQLLERQIKQNAETAKRGSALAQQAVEQDLMATYKLTQQKKQLFAELKKLEDQQQKAVVTQQAVNTGAGKSQMAIQQLAFAVDDAAASFGTGGFAGAMRGAANNLSMLAMMASPVYGALAGIGLAVGGVFVRNWEKSSEQIKKNEEGIKDLIKELDRLDERILRASKGPGEASRIAQQMADQKLLDEARGKKIEASTNKIAARQNLKEAQARVDNLRAAGAAGGMNPAVQAAAETELSYAKAAMDAANDQELAANTRFAAINNKVQQAQRAEGVRRLRDFGGDVSKKGMGIIQGLRSGLRKRADEMDPLNVQIQQQQFSLDKAKFARDQSEFQANADGKITDAEKLLLEKQDKQIQTMELLLKELQLQRKEKDLGNAMARKPIG